jgi:hypothetical protein
MVIVKFMLFAMLLYLAYLMTTITIMTRPRSGPNYYYDMATASVNSIQPQYRIEYLQALGCKHALEVECFNNGVPFRVTKMSYGVRGDSTYYYSDGYGRMRYVGYDVGNGRVVMVRLQPEPKD